MHSSETQLVVINILFYFIFVIYLFQYEVHVFWKISSFLTFRYPADRAIGWHYMSPAPAPGCCSLLPPPLPPTDWQLSIVVNHPHPPPLPPAQPLTVVLRDPVLGATLSDGKTNDFSLASLHAHAQTQRRSGETDKAEERAVRTHKGSQHANSSNGWMNPWTDGHQQTSTLAHNHR